MFALRCLKDIGHNIKVEKNITSQDYFNVSMVDDEDFVELK